MLILVFALAGGRNVCAADNLQSFVTQLFASKGGGVILSISRTRRIMAVVNPQLAIKEAHRPGSTAKIVTSAAVLDGGTADPDPIVSSEHFELEYPLSQQTWVKRTLETLERWRRELGTNAETLPSRVRVETFNTTEGFVRATGEPGWMAASSDGFSISLQPLALLARKQILDQTLRHELTHLVVHRVRVKGVPRWFEEGCVLYLTRERIDAPTNEQTSTVELEAAVAKPGSEAQMRAAYAQALERVRRFAQRQGDAALWRALMHPDPGDLHWFQE